MTSNNNPTAAKQIRARLTHSEFSAQILEAFSERPVLVQKQAKRRVAKKLAQIFRRKR